MLWSFNFKLTFSLLGRTYANMRKATRIYYHSAESCRVILFHTLYPTLQQFLHPYPTLPFSYAPLPYPNLSDSHPHQGCQLCRSRMGYTNFQMGYTRGTFFSPNGVHLWGTNVLKSRIWCEKTAGSSIFPIRAKLVLSFLSSFQRLSRWNCHCSFVQK